MLGVGCGKTVTKKSNTTLAQFCQDFISKTAPGGRQIIKAAYRFSGAESALVFVRPA
jgi:hypothetical protein